MVPAATCHEFLKTSVPPPVLFVEFPPLQSLGMTIIFTPDLSNSWQPGKSQATQSTASFKFLQVTDTQTARSKSITLLRCSGFWCCPKIILEYSDHDKDSELDLIQHFAITSRENQSLNKDTATQFQGRSPGCCLEEDKCFLAQGVRSCKLKSSLQSLKGS